MVGRPLPYNDFRLKYYLGAFPFTKYFGIVHAIPSTWKHSVRGDNVGDNGYVFQIDVTNLSKVIYRQLVQSCLSPPISVEKWNNIFTITEYQWGNIFGAIFASVGETKIQYLQFRFIHRILGTNKLLNRMKLTDNPLCSFCGLSEESIEHLFWDCDISANFILDVEQRVLGSQFILSKSDIIFCYKFWLKHPYNFLIFHMKY